MTIVYIIIHLEWPWPLAMYKVNHFDYCFSKLSLVYIVIINNNPISHWFPTTKVCFFPVLHVKSCRLLWLCSEPLFTSQPSFKNQLLTQSHDKKMKNKKKKEKKQHPNCKELLKLLFVMTKSLPLSFHWPQQVIGPILTSKLCSHLYLPGRGTKSHVAIFGTEHSLTEE